MARQVAGRDEMTIARCANAECLAIFLPPLVYEQLSSFCPSCRKFIQEQLEEALRVFEEAEDGPTN